MHYLIKSLTKEFTSVLGLDAHADDFLPLDLSVHNEVLKATLHGYSTSQDWEEYIHQLLVKSGKKVAYGGYLEHRFLYERSAYFTKVEPSKVRNIHVGIDLWCPASTPVLAPLDGIIHSFQNNLNYGDYGPTIILEHLVNGRFFYTLYGHLTEDSINNKCVGKKIRKGEVFAALGDASVNGDYAPHLHFQLIIDIGNYKGDYPGVSSLSDLTYYRENCPDPNLLLKIY